MMRNLTRTAVLARIEISPRLTRLRAPLAGALSLRRRRMGSDAKHDEHGHSADVIERSPDGKLYVNDRYMGPQEDGVFRWPHVPPPSQPLSENHDEMLYTSVTVERLWDLDELPQPGFDKWDAIALFMYFFYMMGALCTVSLIVVLYRKPHAAPRRFPYMGEYSGFFDPVEVDGTKHYFVNWPWR